MTAVAKVTLRFNGRLADLLPRERTALFDRSTSSDAAIREQTAAIVRDVRLRGDAALRELASRFDRVDLDSLEVPRVRWRVALDALDPSLRRAMERAANNIRRAHEAFIPTTAECETEPGVIVGRRPDPLGRVGVYAPGGRAAYPSSVLMGAVPARVAGVGEVVVCSPPETDGAPSNVILAAAALADADRVFAIGGAGAIAAMAYGTATVPRVDRIVGPGNAYVAEAKLQVAGVVAIDSPAGPSELLVIADESCDPRTAAIEVLAQAEHDPRACVVAVATNERVAEEIGEAIASLLDHQPRREIIIQALAERGGILLADSLDDAIAFSNEYAPEHLLMLVSNADGLLPRIRNAGTVFLGANSSVAFGDYMTGANHVLPTGGLARSYSGLSVLDFFRWTTYQRVSTTAATSLAPDVAAFAKAERLPGHALAARAAGGER
ncbi:MAG TPA: histidinol dehydrogenase [Gemmatimonadaceae bacterium]|nr:histidinol dehydrogenase [Gemmatimonadaceae bacterium]